jgi:hypothetical protein
VVTRRSVWSKKEIQDLLKKFIPAADEVSRLQRGKDTESRLFQAFAEHGHYKGRFKPSNTRQGMYAVTPNGQFLASCNTRHAKTVAKMLHRALERFDKIARSDRQLTDEQIKSLDKTRRWAAKYPEDGLVLRVTTRDLPGAKKGSHRWHVHAWNLDYAWFKRTEALQFVPEEAAVGATRDVPKKLMRRLVCLHLLDNVRGQVSTFRVEDVEKAQLTATIVSIDEDVLELRLQGATRAVQRGRWAVGGFRDHRNPGEQERGFATTMLGHANFDKRTQRFIAFEIVAKGTRWGGTQFNDRAGDLDVAPIGAVLSLGSAETSERVPPARIWNYGWR